MMTENAIKQQHIESLARILCELQHPGVDPSHVPAGVGLMDPLWMYYQGSAQAILKMYTAVGAKVS